MSDGGLWGIDPGVDFPTAFARGLEARFASGRPEDLARVRVYLNNGRMLRRVKAALSDGPARLLPKLSLITDLGRTVPVGDAPVTRSPLQQRLDLLQLVRALLQAGPDLAPQDSAFDLAGTLASLLSEMQGEGVGFDRITGLDLSEHSGHWARSQQFLALLEAFLDQTGVAPDAEGRQRTAVETLARHWAEIPPDHPVIIAGSTGSRGTTHLFMQAVLGLRQGHVVLPGFDFAMPPHGWGQLLRPGAQEDHPQYRFADLMAQTDRAPDSIRRWSDQPAPRPEANRVLSLALRPAPVTDCWQTEGPALPDLAQATGGISLVEAPDPRIEAAAIALALRAAAEEGRKVALISPDRMLTRRVTAALDRWGIIPDDSAGEPLTQTAVGRLLRQIAALSVTPPDSADLIALLKHPLVHSGTNRGAHLLNVRRLELWLRGRNSPDPLGTLLGLWAEKQPPDATLWASWIASCLARLDSLGPEADLKQRTTGLIEIYEQLVVGSGGAGIGPELLWPGTDGRTAQRKLKELDGCAATLGPIRARDFAQLLRGVLAGEVRDARQPHPDIMIWGTLEARVQGADLVILGGLNEAIWPAAPDPDPWLNRKMRAEAGLLSPDRQIGLSAHDFQQAIAAKEVILSRAVRDTQAQTVPSRWLNRLLTLIAGLPDRGGDRALTAMRARGATWLQIAEDLDDPAVHGLRAQRAPRPSPMPPPGTAPDRITVTEVEALLRDPYAIYARRLLGLAPLDPLRARPDPALRGTVIHRALELAGPELTQLDADGLMRITDRLLADMVRWPHVRALWSGRMARVADWFIATEQDRQRHAHPDAFERLGRLPLAPTEVLLTAKLDRADRDEAGRILLYDYKTGHVPTANQQKAFAKQLLLVAAMAEQGGFDGLDPAPVPWAAFIGLGSKRDIVEAPLAEAPPSETLARIGALLGRHIAAEVGYSARRALKRDSEAGRYDHLARYGEWAATAPETPIRVGNHHDG